MDVAGNVVATEWTLLNATEKGPLDEALGDRMEAVAALAAESVNKTLDEDLDTVDSADAGLLPGQSLRDIILDGIAAAPVLTEHLVDRCSEQLRPLMSLRFTPE